MSKKCHVVQSKNGIDLQWVTPDNELYIDGSALYVDNLIDCFQLYQGGSLLEFCKQQYQKELALMNLITPNPIAVSIQQTWKQLYANLQSETEEGLQQMRKAWIADPKGTIAQAIRWLRKGERKSWTPFAPGGAMNDYGKISRSNAPVYSWYCTKRIEH